MQTWQKIALGCGGLVMLLAVALIAGIAIGGGFSNEGQGDAQDPIPDVGPTPAPPQYGSEEAGAQTVTVRASGTEGLGFTGSIVTLDGSLSVEGDVPQEYDTQVDSGDFQFDFVSAVFTRDLADEGEGTLRVEIVAGGEVVKEAETSAQAGTVSVTWSPSE